MKALVIVLALSSIVSSGSGGMVFSFINARNESGKNACVFNMRTIQGAKEQWLLAEGGTNTVGSALDIAAVNNILHDGIAPVCPSGGKFDYGLAGNDPKSSEHGSLSAAVSER